MKRWVGRAAAVTALLVAAGLIAGWAAAHRRTYYIHLGHAGGRGLTFGRDCMVGWDYGPDYSGPPSDVVVTADRAYDLYPADGTDVRVPGLATAIWNDGFRGSYSAVHVRYGPPIGLCVIVGGLLLWRTARRRPVPGHCRRCGYDLRASPGRCPECGAEPAAG